MTKVAAPLFGTSARGRIGDIGTFRMGRHGPEFIALAHGDGGHTERQEAMRACFRSAKAAHAQIPPTPYVAGGKIRYRIVPSWPEYWAQWIIDNPECLS